MNIKWLDYISFILYSYQKYPVILCGFEWVMRWEQSFRVDISKPTLTNRSTETWSLCCINKAMESGTTQGCVLAVRWSGSVGSVMVKAEPEWEKRGRVYVDEDAVSTPQYGKQNQEQSTTRQ